MRRSRATYPFSRGSPPRSNNSGSRPVPSGPCSKLGDVRTRWESDADGIANTAREVILIESLANFARADPHDAVVGKTGAGLAAKHLDRDDPFFQPLGFTIERALHYELQKFLTPLAASEDAAPQDSVELLAKPHPWPAASRRGCRTALVEDPFEYRDVRSRQLVTNSCESRVRKPTSVGSRRFPQPVRPKPRNLCSSDVHVDMSEVQGGSAARLYRMSEMFGRRR